MRKGPDAWVILEPAEAAFLLRGGTVSKSSEEGKHIRISYFPKPEQQAITDIELPSTDLDTPSEEL